MKHAILLINLGTPDAPTVPAVKKFLNEFLSDPDVIPLWKPLRWLLLNTLILPFRSKRTTQLYQKIWQAKGSPLAIISKDQTSSLQHYLEKRDPPTTVALAMRYGKPSIKSALNHLKEAGITHLKVIPLYPQYSVSTSGSAIKAVNHILRDWLIPPKLSYVSYFYDHPLYIEAICHRIRQHWESHLRAEKILFSYHSLPLKMIERGDPYYSHCKMTTELIVKNLNLKPDEYALVFQSRVGRQKWLEPDCEKTLITLAKSGCKQVEVICPGFVADCLETLEEIAIQNKQRFIDAGGESYHYIPALNDSPEFIKLLSIL